METFTLNDGVVIPSAMKLTMLYAQLCPSATATSTPQLLTSTKQT